MKFARKIELIMITDKILKTLQKPVNYFIKFIIKQF